MVTITMYDGPDKEAAWVALLAARHLGHQVSYSPIINPDGRATRFVVTATLDRKLTLDEHTGIYVCITRTCAKRNVEVPHPWCGDWPLDRRRKRCRKCKKFMLFCRLKKLMTAEAKAKLAAFAARKKEIT